MKLNKEIGMLGQKFVCSYFKENKINYWTNFDHNYNITDVVMERKNKMCFVEVTTKKHATIQGYNVTGKNKSQIDNYIKRQKMYGIKYFIIFVDVKKGEMYGNYLDNLLNENYYNGKLFPDVMECNKKLITFFNLHSMIPLQKLTAEQVEELSNLTFKNNQNKNQLSII
jgi:Holliday junction resolvase-like predicted endonuclease